MSSVAKFVLRLSLVCFSSALLSERIESQSPTRAVFVHGAGTTGNTWATAKSLLSPSFPSLDMFNPSLPQNQSLSQQASSLSTYMDGQSVLIGHSNGGLVSRFARANLGSGATGIITVGTPHDGVPALAQLNWLELQAALIAFDAIECLALVPLDAWQQFATSYWSIPLTAGSIVSYSLALDYVQGYVDTFSAFLADDLPGSTFLTGLPSAGANSFALNVTLGNGAGGGPTALVFSPSEAELWGAGLYALGVTIDYLSYQAQFELDYTRPDWYTALIYLFSAQHLAYLAINLPGLWCEVVSGQGCVANDGFVPVASQFYTGAQNTSLTGPAHTYETDNADVVEYIRLRLVGLTN